MSKKFKFNSDKPKEKWKIFNYSELKNQKDMISGPRTEILGNKELIIEGCKGVFEYSDTYIKLKLNKGTLIICGKDFDIITFEGSTINIKGNISSLEFCV